MQPRTRTILAATVGVTVLAALVLHAGLDKIGTALRQANLVLVFVALMCYATFFVLRGVRWAMLLRPVRKDGRRFSVWTTTHATALGWLGNNILPMRAGEMARAGVVAKREGAPFFAVASTVAVERVLDVMGLAVAAAASLLIIPAAVELPAWADLALKLAAVLPVLGLAVLAAAVFARATVTRVVERVLTPVPEKVRTKLLATYEHLVDGAQPVVRSPRLFASASALTLLMTAAQMSIYACLLTAFLPGASWLLAFAGAPWFILTFALSFLPGNIGAYEVAFTAVYASFGLPTTDLLATAVLTHMATFLSVVILGSLSLVALGADGRSAMTRPTAKPAEV